MALIELEDVGLQFRLDQVRVPLKDRFVQKMFRRKDVQMLDAIRNVSLRFTEGERVGIIGHNGAGKSSMLKMLAGIYRPTSGRLTVRGRVDSLLDLGIGIEPDATGWDNIAFRTYLRGGTPRDVAATRQEVADFSELGDRLHTPVRYYSAGMMVRLLFAMATAIEPDILLVDEVMGAGDLSFYEKARRRMVDLIEKARILVSVSHDLGTLESMCTRIIWLDHGRVAADGDPTEVVERYRDAMLNPHRSKAA